MRIGDGGIRRGVNLALGQLVASGLHPSVSVMIPTPWYPETAELPRGHPELDDAELGASVHMNADDGRPRRGRNRQGEFDAPTASRVRDAVSAGRVKLVAYRQLIGVRV